MPFVCACGKRLMASSIHAGRKVACPACGASLVVPAEDSAPAPKAAPQMRRRPFQAAGLFGPLAALALVAGISAAAWWWRSSDKPAADALAYVPTGAEALAVVRLGEAWALLGPEQASAWAAGMERDTGLRPEQVEQAWLVSKDLASEVGWVVVRTSGRYDRDKILSRMEDRVADPVGKHLMVVGRTKANGGKGALAFLDATTLIVGSEAGVLQALAGAEARASRPGPLAHVLEDAKTCLLAAGAAPTARGLEALQARGLPFSVQGVTRAALRASVVDGERIEGEAEFADAATANRIAGAAARAKQAVGVFALLAMEADTTQALERLLGEAKVEETGNTVRLRMRGEAGDLAKALRALPGGMGR